MDVQQQGSEQLHELIAGLISKEVSKVAREAVLRYMPEGVGVARQHIEQEVLAAIDAMLGGNVVSAGAGPALPGPVATPYQPGPAAPVHAAASPVADYGAPPPTIVPIIPPGEAAKLRKTGQRRPADVIKRLEDAVLLVVSREQNLRAAEIAPRVGLLPRDLRDVLINLVKAGKLTTTGQKHGTRYFPPKGAKAGRKPG